MNGKKHGTGDDAERGLDTAFDAIADQRELDWETIYGALHGQSLARAEALRDVNQVSQWFRDWSTGSLEHDTEGTPPSPWLPLRDYVGRSLGKFEILRELGSGGGGVVYDAQDTRTGERVALKIPTLGRERHAELKEEFRARSSVRSEHLVRLFEHHHEHDPPFFTMEYIEGTTAIDYIRQGLQAGQPPDKERLCHVFRGIVEGLSDLHEAALLHRDVKSSNVLVANSGRVVILDLGLAAQASPRGEYESSHARGTFAYMAPEQFDGTSSPATDWYSLGVLLFEALTGRLPFSSAYPRVLTEKSEDISVPSCGLPELESLCQSLVTPNRLDRADANRISFTLGVPPRPAGSLSNLVGRTDEWRELRDCYEDMRPNRTAVALVHGVSGIGKTEFLNRFWRSCDDGVALRGRCFSGESVPFKAIDQLISHLARYLARLGEDATPFFPDDLAPLARMFPAFQTIPALSRMLSRRGDVPDPQEARPRAFQALREMLHRLATRTKQFTKLVLIVDDLQWGDADSASLLAEVLRGPDGPPILFVGTYREEDREASAFLPRFLKYVADEARIDVLQFSLGPLDRGQAAQLALTHIDPTVDDRDEQARLIAEESLGVPFLVVEWARTLSKGDSKEEIEDAFWSRIAKLPPGARRTLQIVSASPGPISVNAVRATARIDDWSSTLWTLVDERWVRFTGQEDEIETYHDRVREAVRARLTPSERRQLHREIAHALERQPSLDSDALAYHYTRAGSYREAWKHAFEAGRKAAGAMAFDSAVRNLKSALELFDRAEEDDAREKRSELQAELANALANAGKGAEAAGFYLAALVSATGREAIELRRRAAEQLLTSGKIDQGMRELGVVLKQLGVPVPGSPRKAWFVTVRQLPRYWFGRTEVVEVEPDQVAPIDRSRIDACFSAVKGLGLVNNVLGAAFQAKHYEFATRAGERYRLCRAFATQALYLGAAGQAGARKSQRLLTRMEELAGEIDGTEQAHARALVPLVTGLIDVFHAEWEGARTKLAEAAETFQTDCVGASYEIDIAQIYELYSLLQLGELTRFGTKLRQHLDEARVKGNLFAEINLRLRYSWFEHLRRHQPDEAIAELNESIGGWAKSCYTSQHYCHLRALSQVHLYQSDGDAREIWERGWPKLKASMLLRIRYLAIEAIGLRARCALATAAWGAKRFRRSALADARRGLRRLLKANWRDTELVCEWTRGQALLIQAGVACLEQRSEAAARHLRDAETSFGHAGMNLHEFTARRRRGQLIGGDEGAELISETDKFLRSHAVSQPECVADIVAPGVWR